MRLSTVFASLAVLVTAVVAAPGATLKAIETYNGETNGKYIVRFKEGVNRGQLLRQFNLSNNVVNLDIINGVSAEINEETLNALRASDDVEAITEDGIMHIFATQTNAPWGLQRVNQAARLTNTNVAALTFTYTFHDSAGQGVDVYVADTGVFIGHSQFGGRARHGGTFGTTGSTDGHGHGTHCAGTIAGSQFGVAKNANIVAVKVLSDAGSGSISGIVSGLDFVRSQAASSGRPSIVSMSLGGGANSALDSAVASLTSAGIHVVVAAGNSNVDAINTSPARAPSAITVGASTITDTRASFSNFGSIVDVFAPGQDVISSWIGSTTATNRISGTSMATPHVAGVAAYLIARDGNQSPAALEAKIKSLSLKGVLSGIPSGTANNLLQNIP